MVFRTYKKNLFDLSNNFGLIKIHFVFFFTVILTKIILAISGIKNPSNYIYQFLSLPTDIQSFINHPWSLFTFFFIFNSLGSIVFNMVLLYNLSNIFSRLFNYKKFIFLYFSGNIIAGILVLLLYRYLPGFRNVQSYLYGCLPGIYAVLIGLCAFAPNFPVFLFFFGSVRLKFIGLIFLLFSLFEFSNGVNCFSTSQVCGAIWGFVYVSLLSKGVDLGKPFDYIVSVINYLFCRRKKNSKSNKIKVTIKKI